MSITFLIVNFVGILNRSNWGIKFNKSTFVLIISSTIVFTLGRFLEEIIKIKKKIERI